MCLAYPYHSEVSLRSQPCPDGRFPPLVFQRPPIVAIQIDLEQVKVFVFSHSNFVHVHDFKVYSNCLQTATRQFGNASVSRLITYGRVAFENNMVINR